MTDQSEEVLSYECNLFPKNAGEENKTGIVIKGNDSLYINASKMLSEFFSVKGEQFHINGVDLTVADTPKNKPISMEVKDKGGLTGKANLKIYEVNMRGSATIMVTKISGGEMSHVKVLAYSVIKFLLNKIISGNISNESILKFKTKTLKKVEEKCSVCGLSFTTANGLRLHIVKVHPTIVLISCDTCGKGFHSRADLENHMQLDHEFVETAKDGVPQPMDIDIDEVRTKMLPYPFKPNCDEKEPKIAKDYPYSKAYCELECFLEETLEKCNFYCSSFNNA